MGPFVSTSGSIVLSGLLYRSAPVTSRTTRSSLTTPTWEETPKSPRIRHYCSSLGSHSASLGHQPRRVQPFGHPRLEAEPQHLDLLVAADVQDAELIINEHQLMNHRASSQGNISPTAFKCFSNQRNRTTTTMILTNPRFPRMGMR